MALNKYLQHMIYYFIILISLANISWTLFPDYKRNIYVDVSISQGSISALTKNGEVKEYHQLRTDVKVFRKL